MTNPLQAVRKAAKLSQGQAAVVLDTHKDYLSRLERGLHKPGRQLLEKMADEYGKRIDGGVTTDQLLGRSPLPEAANASA